jgi:CxxC motif-containing protein
MEREFVCIICPNGCQISVEYEGTNIKNIKGDECPKGKESGDFSLVSVKTPSPIPKKYLKKIGEITRHLKVKAPVEIGQVVAFNLLDENIAK